MKGLSILACPNGFGHFRRINHLVSRLSKSDVVCSLYTSKDHWDKFLSSKGGDSIDGEIITNNLEVIDCKWFPCARDYRDALGSRFQSDWEKLMIKLENQYVYSDNYIEPWFYGARGALFSNFIWNKDLGNMSVWEIRSRMISDPDIVFSYDICADYMMDIGAVNEVPYFGGQKSMVDSEEYALIVLGRGYWCESYASAISEFLYRHNGLLKSTYFASEFNQGVFKNHELTRPVVDVTPDVIAKAKVVIGRPSLGIVSDCFSMGVPFFPISVTDDVEATRNATKIIGLYKKAGIAVAFPAFLKTQRDKYVGLVRFRGEELVATYLEKVLWG